MTGNPYKVTATDLRVSKLAEIGAVSTTSIELTNANPKPGETISVTATIENTGLTTAKNGYTVDFYECRNGAIGDLIAEAVDYKPMIANAAAKVTFDWTVPADLDGVCIAAIARENGYANTDDPLYSSELILAANYDVSIMEVEQIEGEQFTARYHITNTGNAAASGEKIELRFAALYQSFEQYGLDTDLLATAALGDLKPGESRDYTTSFTVPAQAFDLIGFDELVVQVVDAENMVKAGDSRTMRMKKPLSVTLNGGSNLIMQVGDSEGVKVDYGNKWLNRLNTVTLTSADVDVAQVDAEGNVVAVGAGMTTITATVASTGMQDAILVTVLGDNPFPNPAPIEPDEPEEPEEEEVTELIPFEDVPENEWYYDAVVWAYDKHLMIGTSETEFSPHMTLNRAMIATILYRYEGEPEVPEGCNFTDVPEGMWYSDAIAWAENAGVIKGYGNGTYGPMDPATREQFALILKRYAEMKNIETAGMTCNITWYDDYEEISSWAEESIEWAAAVGIMQGSNTSMMPKDEATRAQAITMLNRFVYKLELER